jgi:hypothetical protein
MSNTELKPANVYQSHVLYAVAFVALVLGIVLGHVFT